MPYRITRPEVAKRLAIKAMASTTPGNTYRDLARLFCTSFSAVRDALRRPIAHWAGMLKVAPVPSKKARVKPAVPQVLVIPSRPGNREHVRLEKPESPVSFSWMRKPLWVTWWLFNKTFIFTRASSDLAGTKHVPRWTITVAWSTTFIRRNGGDEALTYWHWSLEVTTFNQAGLQNGKITLKYLHTCWWFSVPIFYHT